MDGFCSAWCSPPPHMGFRFWIQIFNDICRCFGTSICQKGMEQLGIFLEWLNDHRVQNQQWNLRNNLLKCVFFIVSLLALVWPGHSLTYLLLFCWRYLGGRLFEIHTLPDTNIEFYGSVGLLNSRLCRILFVGSKNSGTTTLGVAMACMSLPKLCSTWDV